MLLMHGVIVIVDLLSRVYPMQYVTTYRG